jgi:hypothetical protein
MAKKKIIVQGTEISLMEQKEEDFISLTDIARQISERTDIVVSNWLRNRNTVEYLGVWEQLHNSDFNSIGFDGIKSQTGLNSFFLTVKQWIAETNAIGMYAKAGRYGGTYAHKDIAFEFCSFVSPIFKLYLLKEFQRLKEEEAKALDMDWQVKRIMSKANYRIHTEAIRQHLIPPKIARTKMEGLYFASEADVLNVALFGMTAKQWREQNPDKKGNIRDHSTAEQLLVLSNLQSLNAKLMKWGCDDKQRLQILNESAIEEMNILLSSGSLGALPGDENKRIGE